MVQLVETSPWPEKQSLLCAYDVEKSSFGGRSFDGYDNRRDMRTRNAWARRRAAASERGRRLGALGNAAQARARMERVPDADTLRQRTLEDARGQTLREGVTYGDGRVIAWRVRRSQTGRTNQVDVLANGRVRETCGARAVARRLRDVSE